MVKPNNHPIKVQSNALDERKKKAFFLWLCSIKQSHEWFAYFDEPKEYKTRIMWKQFKMASNALVTDFEYELKQMDADLIETFWEHSEQISNLMEAVYKKCPTDGEILDAVVTMEQVISKRSMVIDTSDTQLNSMLIAYLSADDKVKQKMFKEVEKLKVV